MGGPTRPTTVNDMTFPARRPSVRRWARASATVLLCGLALVACSDETVPTSGDTREGKSTRSPKPAKDASDTGSPTSEPSSEPSDDGSAAVPVYFAGDGPGGETRLFREFQRVTGDPLLEAARLVAGGEVEDPDYRTLWPATAIDSVQATDGEILVDIASDAFTERPDGMSERDARLAIQQLVYTLQGVQQARVPVRVVREGGATRLFGIDTAVPFEAATALDTLNLVSITSPVEGQTITGDSFVVTGVANSFEASGPCRILQDGQELALVPYTATGWTDDRLFPFAADLPLTGISGEVVLQCETDDPSGGAEGNGPSVDTKNITIQ
jgi:hypothetical protein